jgi:hypothetical protein
VPSWLSQSSDRRPAREGRKWPVSGTQLGWAVVTASAALLVTAACGGSGSSGNNAQAANNGGTGQGRQALTAYVDCMKQNGVVITVPSGNPSGRPRGSGQPTDRPTNFPTARPSGSPGAGGGRGFGGALQKPDNVDQATWDKARTACASKLPSFGPGNGNGNNGANTAYRNCLKDHGVTVNGGTNQLNTADPTIAAAEKACAPLRPTTRPSAAPSATT